MGSGGRNLPRGEEVDAYWMARGVLEDLKLGTGLLWCTSSVVAESGQKCVFHGASPTCQPGANHLNHTRFSRRPPQSLS